MDPANKKDVSGNNKKQKACAPSSGRSVPDDDGCRPLSPPQHRTSESSKPVTNSETDDSKSPYMKMAPSSPATTDLEVFPDTVAPPRPDAAKYYNIRTKDDLVLAKQNLYNNTVEGSATSSDKDSGDVEKNVSTTHQPPDHSWEEMEARSRRRREQYGTTTGTMSGGGADRNPAPFFESINENTASKNYRPKSVVQHIEGPHLASLDGEEEEQEGPKSETFSSRDMGVPVAAEVVGSNEDLEAQAERRVLQRLVQDMESQAEERAMQRIAQDAPRAEVVHSNSKVEIGEGSEQSVHDASQKRRCWLLMVLGGIGLLVVVGLAIALVFVLKGDEDEEKTTLVSTEEPRTVFPATQKPTTDEPTTYEPTTAPPTSEQPTTPRPTRNSCGTDCGIEPEFPAVAGLSFSLSNCELDDSWTMLLCAGGTSDGCNGLSKVVSFDDGQGVCTDDLVQLNNDGNAYDNSDFEITYLSFSNYPWDEENTCTGTYEWDFEDSTKSHMKEGTFNNGTLLCNNGDIIAYLGLRDDSPGDDNYYLYYATDTPNDEINYKSYFTAMKIGLEDETGEYCLDLFSLMSKLLVDLRSSSASERFEELSCGHEDDDFGLYNTLPTAAGIHFSLDNCTLHHSWLLTLCIGGINLGCSYLKNYVRYSDFDGQCNEDFYYFYNDQYNEDGRYSNSYWESSSLSVSNTMETCDGTYKWAFTSFFDDYDGSFTNGKLLCNNGHIISYLGQTDDSGGNYYLHYATKTQNSDVNEMNEFEKLSFYFEYEAGEYCLGLFALMSKLLVDLRSSSPPSSNNLSTLSCGRRKLGESNGYPAVAGLHFTPGTCALHHSWLMVLCTNGNNNCNGLRNVVSFVGNNEECSNEFKYYFHDGGGIDNDGWYSNSDLKSTSLLVSKNESTCNGNYVWEFNDEGSFDNYNGTFTNTKLLCNDGEVFSYLGQTGDDDDYYIYFATNTANNEVNEMTSFNSLSKSFESEKGRYCGASLYILMTMLLNDLSASPDALEGLSCGPIAINDASEEPTETVSPPTAITAAPSL